MNFNISRVFFRKLACSMAVIDRQGSFARRNDYLDTVTMLRDCFGCWRAIMGAIAAVGVDSPLELAPGAAPLRAMFCLQPLSCANADGNLPPRALGSWMIVFWNDAECVQSAKKRTVKSG
ncbi:MAG: hypothetical protein HHJ09_05680 [Glaciimonas sp.]|nr:hypothetical protein [Glaciimonas sp.]